MFKWHDAVYIGRDLSSQFTNCTPIPDRSGLVSHLEEVGAIRRASGRDCRQGQGRRKEG